MIAARSPRFIQTYAPDSAALQAEALAGLQAPQAHAAPKFFYDRLGSHLFEAITELPEYYPTRTETAILTRYASEMAKATGTGGTLIDLGAGNCAKAMRLVSTLEPARYVAVDISVDFLRDALLQVQRAHPGLDVIGVGMDFSESLELPPQARGASGSSSSQPIFFYPGSSIGNFTPEQAAGFLRKVRNQADGGGVLIGVDLVKNSETLQQAYDDALGVTAAFNLNLLRCLNRLLGTDFDPRGWQHVALYNQAQSRIEMHLEARKAQTVRWSGGERRFESGERIHTENSCKYTREGFGALLVEAGFREPLCWTDDAAQFAVFWAAG
ncbi:L-histidine N(alpha)-methyltransferase [soil metagenome]